MPKLPLVLDPVLQTFRASLLELLLSTTVLVWVMLRVNSHSDLEMLSQRTLVSEVIVAVSTKHYPLEPGRAITPRLVPIPLRRKSGISQWELILAMDCLPAPESISTLERIGKLGNTFDAKEARDCRSSVRVRVAHIIFIPHHSFLTSQTNSSCNVSTYMYRPSTF